VDFRAVSDTHRFGILVPDEDPPGNQVTPRVENATSLSWAATVCPDAHTPEHPGEIVSPRILRHAPSCYILVTQRAADWAVRAAF